MKSTAKLQKFLVVAKERGKKCAENEMSRLTARPLCVSPLPSRGGAGGGACNLSHAEARRSLSTQRVILTQRNRGNGE